MNTNRIPKTDDLIRMSELLNNEFGENFDLSMMEIRFVVGDSMVKRINDDLYYRYNADGEPDPTDEVAIKANGITFKYVGDEI
jgi:hypothetical protein